MCRACWIAHVLAILLSVTPAILCAEDLVLELEVWQFDAALSRDELRQLRESLPAPRSDVMPYQRALVAKRAEHSARSTVMLGLASDHLSTTRLATTNGFVVLQAFPKFEADGTVKITFIFGESRITPWWSGSSYSGYSTRSFVVGKSQSIGRSSNEPVFDLARNRLTGRTMFVDATVRRATEDELSERLPDNWVTEKHAPGKEADKPLAPVVPDVKPIPRGE